MKLVRLSTEEQLKNLKRGDVVIVEWKDGARELHWWGRITHHSIYGVIDKGEVILDVKRNSYFQIERYLRGESYAKDVFLACEDGDPR